MLHRLHAGHSHAKSVTSFVYHTKVADQGHSRSGEISLENKVIKIKIHKNFFNSGNAEMLYCCEDRYGIPSKFQPFRSSLTKCSSVHKLTDLFCFFSEVYQYNLCIHTQHLPKYKTLKNK